MNRVGIYGLVLAGGKSTRMGKDKGYIAYHGMPQNTYLYNMLNDLCDQTFLSIRSDQQGQYEDFNVIIDQDLYKGPFNGLLSAHQKHPNVAWLVVACDLPLIDRAALQHLINSRNTKMAATAFATKKTGLPEPLAAIWEPGGLKDVPEYLENSRSSCPRKYLLSSDVHLVFPNNDEVLLNANFEEEYLEVMKKLTTI